jgi:hypothetical protein
MIHAASPDIPRRAPAPGALPRSSRTSVVMILAAPADPGRQISHDPGDAERLSPVGWVRPE